MPKLKTTRTWVNIVVGVLGLSLIPLTIPDMRLNKALLVLFWIIAVITVAVSETLEEKPTKTIIKWTAIAAIGWGILFGGEYKLIAYENSPRLSAKLDLLSVGDLEDSPPVDAYFTVALVLKNEGSPTTITKWSLDVTVPGGTIKHADWLEIERGVHHVAREDGVDIVYSGEDDDLAHKVRELPFGSGARPWGYLQFVVRGMSSMEARKEGTLIHISFADDEGHEGVLDHVMSGKQLRFSSPGTYIQHGSRVPPR